jgi:C-terminal processing protease CtpA/Prc
MRARSLQAEVASREAERDARIQQLAQLQSSLEAAEAAEAEIQILRKQKEELARLRGQYQEWQQLKQEHERLRQEHEQLKTALQQATAAPRAPGSSWIGIIMQAQPGGGVGVQGVVPGSPATGSGLAPGDVISAVDGRTISSPQEFRDLIASKPVGSAVTLDALRQGRPFRVVIATAPLPP